MKNNIEKVYGKLPKKVNLKNHKVDLALIDDVVNAYENIKNESDSLYMKVRKAAQDIDEVTSESRNIIEKIYATEDNVSAIIESTNNLGIELPSEVSVAIRQLEAYRSDLEELESRTEVASDGLFNMLG
jgi:vacuolar-type H+-ATPase subunit D/Vma8